MEHELILPAGIVDDGVHEGRRVGGKGGSEADPVLTVMRGHSLVQVHSLSAAHADEGLGDLRKGLHEVDQLLKLLMSGVPGKLHGISLHPMLLELSGDADGEVIVEVGVDDQKGGFA